MPDPIQSERPAGRKSIRGWSVYFTALLPLLACFLGGGTAKWAEGMVVALLGLFLVACPPRLSLGKATNLVMAGVLILAGVAFLPARWFFYPAWRSILTADFGVVTPATVSPQPWITATALISLIAGLSWLYAVATQETELRAVRSQLRFFVTGIVFLAAISIILYLLRTPFPFWINQRNFGPFPNRNQTGDLFGIACIVLLACGQDDLRRGRKRWLLWLVGLVILIAAIILNLSRAGMAILIVGSFLWIAVVTLRQRSSARLAVAVSFILLLLAAILISGGQTLERFHLHGLVGPGLTTDFRWKIFHDAGQLIRSCPWPGIGLGNFDPVFAMFRAESLAATRALHPESDWIWLWAEAGWPVVVLVIIGGGLIIRRVLPLQEGTNQRFRLAALIGAVAFAFHGLVDVSGHRVGTAYAGLFLLGTCLHRPLELVPSRVVPVMFRFVGFFLMVSGASWVVAAHGNRLLPGSVGVSTAKQLSPVAIRGRNFSESISLNSRALEWAPLDWQLYFARGLAEVGAKQPDRAVDDFRRARFLEPNAFEVPLAEGNAWLSSQPVFAATAWREALRRTQTGRERLEVYGGMLNKAAVENPEVGHILAEIGLTQHDLVLAYLARVSGARFTHELSRFLQNDPDLKTLTEPEKLALFSLWSERGELEELSKQVETHPDWMAYAWLGLARDSANKKDFQKAYQLTERFGDAVALPRISGGESSLQELQNRYVANSDNYAVGYALYREQIQRGLTDDALGTARHFSERANAPAYFHFLEAQGWAAKQNWERAWNAWLAYRDAAAAKK